MILPDVERFRANCRTEPILEWSRRRRRLSTRGYQAAAMSPATAVRDTSDAFVLCKLGCSVRPMRRCIRCILSSLYSI